MMLTRAADYAVRVMIHLAGLPPGARATRADLAAAANGPSQFLSKVLQGLTRRGLVISHRGHAGGFELAAVHRSASVLEIVEAIEGPLLLNLCVKSDQECPEQSSCPSSGVWVEAQRAMTGALRGVSIGDLASKAARHHHSLVPATALKLN